MSTLVDASNTARRNGIGAYGLMTSALVDMEKPQAVYQGFVTRPVQISRSEPFVPLIMHDDEKRRAFESRGEGTINEMGMASVEVEVTPVEHSWGMKFDGYIHRI